MKLSAFVTNLGKYNEGYLVGEWVTFPIDEEEEEELYARIGIDGVSYEEVFITDYEVEGISLDELGEYTPLNRLNEIASAFDGLDEWEMEIVSALMSDGESFEEALENKDDCIIWHDCSSMTDVAERYADETGLLDSIPENLRYYFDFESFGRDMGYEGRFIFTDSGNCVEARL